MNIQSRIENIVKELGQEYSILQYAYNSKTFVPGESPVYYSGMYWGEEEIVAAISSLLTGKWVSAGEEVRAFEKEFSEKICQRFGVMVNSGSSANLIMLAALKKYYKWEDGDEIIVSVVGFPTTVSVICQNNLKPVFIDVEWETLNFNIFKIHKKISPKTKAIFLSPVLGNPPYMDDVQNLCEKFGLKLILDCCDSLGSKWEGLYLCEYAVASSHSFYPAHTISTGEGGMVTTDIREIANIVRSMASWGRACVCSGTENLLPNGICNHRFDYWLSRYNNIVDHKYVFPYMGYNLKPLDLQGAIGRVQVKKLDEIIERRNKSNLMISEIFRKYLNVSFPAQLEWADTAWFGTPIICANAESKDKLVRYLEKKKIQTRNYFAGNILIHPGYAHLGNYLDYPVASKIYDQVFFVGASPHYDEKVFQYFEKVLEEYNE